MKSSRLRKKVRKVEDMMNELREKSLISVDFLDELLAIGRPDILSIIENELRNATNHPGAVRYSDETKKSL